uniref:Uncharacterized protein n=1 Tax=Anguilla anguilla TaxID=7936 RepID=A0A0E9XLN2_ANGAN
MKRTKCEFKETTIPSNFNFALKTDSAGILKPHNNVPRKKFTATTYKGPSSRLETELRDQKRLLEAFNGDLQKIFCSPRKRLTCWSSSTEIFKEKRMRFRSSWRAVFICWLQATLTWI